MMGKKLYFMPASEAVWDRLNREQNKRHPTFKEEL